MEILELIRKDYSTLNDNSERYRIISFILDCLAIAKFEVNMPSVSMKQLQELLESNATLQYWDIEVIKTELFIRELKWLNLIDVQVIEGEEYITINKNGIEALKDKRYHSISASLQEAKTNRQLFIISIIIAFISFLVAIAALVVTIYK